MNKNLGPQILKLREEGKTYQEIVNILGTNKGTVSYHCGIGQKNKARERQAKRRNKHPFISKMSRFINRKFKVKKEISSSLRKRLYEKVRGFLRSGANMNQPFTLEDVIAKFGDNPTCYITGQSIDIDKPRTYNFDHIIPVSKGGSNSLDNLGICTREANMSKNDMTYEEFVNFCKMVVKQAEAQGQSL